MIPKPTKRAPRPRRRIARTSRPPSRAKLESQRKRLHRKAWALWSEWIRRSAADDDGLVACYTCRRVRPWQEMHAGHYLHGALDFEPRNIHAQCAQCNTFRHGAGDLYTLRLIDEIGRADVDALRQLAALRPRYEIADLEAIIADTRAKLATLGAR